MNKRIALFQACVFVTIGFLCATADGWGPAPECPLCQRWNGSMCVNKCTPNTQYYCCIWDIPPVRDLCCNRNEGCCDAKTCYNPATEQCCHRGDGSKCNPSCCNSFNCQYCLPGAGCGQCLRKVSTYAELSSCSKVDDPTTEPSANGCGPKGWGWIIPDNPTGCEHTSFTQPCNAHDLCYGDCTKSFGSCNGQFGAGMHAKCEALTGEEREDCYEDCQDNAELYYSYVTGDIGYNVYKGAQVSACACCDCD
jgi:hypothetical protein